MMLALEKIGSKEGYIERYVWQPGNGTRYEFLVTITPKPFRWLLVWENYGRAIVFGTISEESFLSYDYLMEKMKLGDERIADVAAILGFIEASDIAEVMYPPDFVAPGIYKRN